MRAGMATGGSGDVLAGYLAGHLAQPILARDPMKAIGFAVWAHGRGADTGVLAQDRIANFARRIGRRPRNDL